MSPGAQSTPPLTAGAGSAGPQTRRFGRAMSATGLIHAPRPDGDRGAYRAEDNAHLCALATRCQHTGDTKTPETNDNHAIRYADDPGCPFGPWLVATPTVHHRSVAAPDAGGPRNRIDGRA